MTVTRRAAILAIIALIAGAWPGTGRAQTVTAARPSLTPQEMEDFLLHARIVAKKGITKGVTNARRVTLSDGQTTHDAQIQDVDIFLPIFEVGPKYTEVNFRDTYRYNVAGYRLAMLLGLGNVPMSVERKIEGKPSAVTWWIDDVATDETKRQKSKEVGPNPSRTAGYIHMFRVFDELIQNRDRNGGNLLWTADWKMWMIDHTRAFRLGKDLLKPQLLERCERTLCENMRQLTAELLTERMGTSLTKEEINALLVRRDLIIKLFDEKIATRSEAAVLYTMPQ